DDGRPAARADDLRAGLTGDPHGGRVARVDRGAEVVAVAVADVRARALRDHDRIGERAVRRTTDGDDLRVDALARLAVDDDEVADAVRPDRRIEEIRVG